MAFRDKFLDLFRDELQKLRETQSPDLREVVILLSNIRRAERAGFFTLDEIGFSEEEMEKFRSLTNQNTNGTPQ